MAEFTRSKRFLNWPIPDVDGDPNSSGPLPNWNDFEDDFGVKDVGDAPDDSDGNTQSCRAKEPISTDDDYELSDDDSSSESSESNDDVDRSVHGPARSSMNPKGTPVIIVTTRMVIVKLYSTPRNSNCGRARKLHYGNCPSSCSVVSTHYNTMIACINNTHIVSTPSVLCRRAFIFRTWPPLPRY